MKQNNFAKELDQGCYLLKMIKNRSLSHSTSGLHLIFKSGDSERPKVGKFNGQAECGRSFNGK